MKVLLIIIAIGFVIYWFNTFVLWGRLVDYKNEGHTLKKANKSALTTFLNGVKFIVFSLIPLFNLVMGFLFATKAVTIGVIENIFED